MNLAAWAERSGVARVTAYRWFGAGLLPVPAHRVGQLNLVDEPTGKAGVCGRVAMYSQVSSADQKADLDGRVSRVSGWAATEQMPVDRVVTEVGSALNGGRRTFLRCCVIDLWAGSWWSIGSGSAGFGSEDVQAALAAQGRELVVVDSSEVDDDLVADMTEILTSTCARLYGIRAKRALAAADAGKREAS